MRRGQQPTGMIDGRLGRVKYQALSLCRRSWSAHSLSVRCTPNRASLSDVLEHRVHFSRGSVRVALAAAPEKAPVLPSGHLTGETAEVKNLRLGSPFFI
jgi:hypothetical protein